MASSSSESLAKDIVKAIPLQENAVLLGVRKNPSEKSIDYEIWIKDVSAYQLLKTVSLASVSSFLKSVKSTEIDFFSLKFLEQINSGHIVFQLFDPEKEQYWLYFIHPQKTGEEFIFQISGSYVGAIGSQFIATLSTDSKTKSSKICVLDISSTKRGQTHNECSLTGDFVYGWIRRANSCAKDDQKLYTVNAPTSIALWHGIVLDTGPLLKEKNIEVEISDFFSSYRPLAMLDNRDAIIYGYTKGGVDRCLFISSNLRHEKKDQDLLLSVVKCVLPPRVFQLNNRWVAFRFLEKIEVFDCSSVPKSVGVIPVPDRADVHSIGQLKNGCLVLLGSNEAIVWDLSIHSMVEHIPLPAPIRPISVPHIVFPDGQIAVITPSEIKARTSKFDLLINQTINETRAVLGSNLPSPLINLIHEYSFFMPRRLTNDSTVTEEKRLDYK
jgi:hypothetical protein